MQLVISEKPSQARSYASALGVNARKDGYFEGAGYIIAWCYGHLLELAAPDAYDERYAKWRYEDLPIVPKTWKHAALKGKEAQLKMLKDLMQRSDVDSIINACDAGREGELIFRLVYEYAQCKKPLQRLWVSSLEDKALREGFNHLENGAAYDNLYAAASCREKADWEVGISATRLFSVLYGGVTLNVGRVQSPTLAMLVKREAEIAAFVKEPFYTPVIDCGFTASGEKLKARKAAETIRAAIEGQEAVVTSVEHQQKSIAPPKLYDLTTLQREANRLLGFTAQQTLDYAQSLYEKKLLSYPRTDSRYLTEDMRDTAGALATYIAIHSPFAGGASFTPNLTPLIDNSKVTDHHALIPTAEYAKVNFAALPSGESDILNLVAMRLLCATAPKHSYEAVTAVLNCGEYRFTAKGKTVIKDGWQAIDRAFRTSLKNKLLDDNDPEGDAALPELAEGQIFTKITATVHEGATTPPKHFTEDLLLSAMETAGEADMPEITERKGLGTPATRAAIIEKLIKTGFVSRQKKNLIPTDKGKNLIAVLPAALTSAKLTAEWESRLQLVERGDLSGGKFMDDINVFVTTIVAENKAPKPEFLGVFPKFERNGRAKR